jgi:hypothetical protein
MAMNRAVGVAASVGMSPASVRSVFLLRRAFTSRVSASSSGSGSGVWSRISGVSRVSRGKHPALLQNWGLPTCVSVRGLRTARKSAPSKKPDAGVNEDKDGHAKADINTQANVDQFHEIQHAKKSLQEGKGSTALSQTEVERPRCGLEELELGATAHCGGEHTNEVREHIHPHHTKNVAHCGGDHCGSEPNGWRECS